MDAAKARALTAKGHGCPGVRQRGVTRLRTCSRPSGRDPDARENLTERSERFAGGPRVFPRRRHGCRRAGEGPEGGERRGCNPRGMTRAGGLDARAALLAAARHTL